MSARRPAALVALLTRRPGRKSSLFVAGSVASLVGLVSTSVVAARLLGTDSFSAYAAMVSVMALLGSGVAAAMEQEAARSTAERGLASDLRPVLRHSGLAVSAAAALALVPTGWQSALFNEQALPASLLVAAGVVGLHAGAIGRGVLAGTDRRALLGLSIALTGSLPLAVGLLLTWLGVDGFLAFGVGTVVGAGSGAIVALPALVALVVKRTGGSQATVALGKLIAGNVFLTANMVAVPAVLRVHVDDLSASVVASLQIVVSLSRLSTLLVANTVPVVIARTVRFPRGRFALAATAGAAGFGTAAVVGTTVLAPYLLPLVFGTGFDVTFGQAALGALSVLFLNPAYVLTGVAVGRGRSGLVAWSWAAGAIVLALVAVWPSPSGISAVLMGITLSAAIPALLLLGGLTVLAPSTTDKAAG